MQDNIEKLLQNLKKSDCPANKANELTCFTLNELKSNQIILFEAYLLNGEVINCTRDNYLQPAWNGRVQISTCLQIYNHWLMALVFRDEGYTENLEQWYLESVALNTEKRKHYILHRAEEFLTIRENSNLS